MSTESEAPSSPALRLSLLSALIMATWAAVANASHGAYLAARAAATQGLVTATLTLTVTLVVERLWRLARVPWARVAVATVGAGCAALCLSFTLHTILGTPERIRTLLPPWLVGVFYAALYALRLERLSAQADFSRVSRNESADGA
jgi:hypothetical protein